MASLEAITGRNEVGVWLNGNGLTGEGVEIGVQEGRNAEAILTHWHGRLHLVDPWMKQPADDYRDGTNDIDFDAAFKDTMRRMRPFEGRFIIYRALSDDAFRFYVEEGIRFDFIYLDGNHSSPQVNRDLDNWWQLLKPGGLFGGHDYLTLDAPEWRCDVEQAVNEFCAIHALPLHVTNEEGGWPSWWSLKLK